MSSQQTEPQPDPGARIVVGVDDSAHSRIALRWAIEEAARTGRTVHAVMVWNPDPLFATPPPVFVPFEDIQSEFLAKLTDRIAEAHHEHADVAVTHELCEGSAAKQLVAQADGAAMLVIGSHGRSRIGTALLGSVGAACVRHASCPVLIIPPHLVPEQTGAEQAVSAVPQQIAGPWL